MRSSVIQPINPSGVAKLEGEYDRHDMGRWRSVCSVERGDILVELQSPTKGTGVRIIASRLLKVWHEPRDRYSSGFYSYHYFPTKYLPTPEDRLTLTGKGE